METIASIIGNIGMDQRRPSQGSRWPTRTPSDQQETKPEEDKSRIRSDKAIEEGWSSREAPPEPKTCEFCQETLYHYGLILPFGSKKEVFRWGEEPERCSCKKAQEKWARIEAELEAKRVAEEQAEESRRLQARVDKLTKDSGIRGRFLNRTFETFQVDKQNQRAYNMAKSYAEAFPTMLPQKDKRSGHITPPDIEKNGIMIIGSYGTGKTHLAAAISNQLIKSGTPVICMTMIDLLARIKETFDRSEQATEADIMRIYEEVPLLVIDDIGSEQPTEWGSAKVYAIINARYEAYMPTIITTNYKGQELIERMTPDRGDGKNAEKTIDRLREMCLGLEMNWESWRARRR